MKRKLDICFTKLNLLETRSGVKSLKQLPPIAAIKDWIDDFRANVAVRQLHEFYAPKLKKH